MLIMTKAIVKIFVWSGLIITGLGILMAFDFNFIFGSIIIAIGVFIILSAAIVNNNEIISEEAHKRGY